MVHEAMALKNNFAVLHRNIELQGLPELARTQSEQVAKPIQLFSRTLQLDLKELKSVEDCHSINDAKSGTSGSIPRDDYQRFTVSRRIQN